MKPLVNKKYKLEKYHGKGGWTYASIPEVVQNKENPFGWVRVSGSIDNYELDKCTLMPMGNGGLFLPVKAEIRKKIGKEEGDWVHVILYADNTPLETPNELQLCLEDEPKALKFFHLLSESERRYYINWIYSAKKEETKISRMAKTIDRLIHGLKMYDKMED